ncbi:hypothetical protein HU200_048287 [Digitaria exilis]|uniref:Cytochrome P450 n=1 Tax=Digitaria exilis TaxID=1010633 RepID=A0A835AY63_9POAL|nr:hypothetical protein HU200_048287 [Digitaria exilis]
MAITTLCLIFIFLILFLLELILTRSRTKQPALHLPPGPWQLPLIGSLHHILLSRFRDLPHQALRELSGTHGPLMLLRFGSVPTLVASSAEAAREVMRTHDLAFCSRHLSATLDIISRGGNDVLFSPYNDQWRELRKVCVLELFNPRRVLSFRPVREEEVARLIRSVSGECGSGSGGGGGGGGVDVGEAICRMVNDVVVSTAIGGRCERRDEFLRELDEAVRLTGGFNLADLYPSSRLARRISAAARDMARCQKSVYRIVESIIHERAATRMPEREEDDLLGVLLRLQREGGLQFDLTNEIEALRLHAPVPFLLPRECRETCKVMGYDVPKGAKVFVNVWAIARDNKFWGDGEAFRPERFEGCSVDFRGNDFEFTPFGAGRRICPGITHGLANMELVLASLLYHFDWELDGELDMTEAFGITKQPASKRKARAYTYEQLDHHASVLATRTHGLYTPPTPCHEGGVWTCKANVGMSATARPCGPIRPTKAAVFFLLRPLRVIAAAAYEPSSEERAGGGGSGLRRGCRQPGRWSRSAVLGLGFQGCREVSMATSLRERAWDGGGPAVVADWPAAEGAAARERPGGGDGGGMARERLEEGKDVPAAGGRRAARLSF